MKRIFSVILLAFLLSALFVGCSKDSANDAESVKWPVYGDVIDRDTWNIELEFIKSTESGIIIEMRDLDNKGFYMNDFYFILEKFENEEWVKIVDPKPAEAHEGLSIFCLPNAENGFSSSWSINSYKARDPGHYRITKILKNNTASYGGQVFSIEFDIK